MHKRNPLFPWILSGILSAAPLTSVLADHSFTPPSSVSPEFPWLTGPLIAPTGTVIPKGHYTLQPYLYFFVYNGNYNSHWHTRSMPNFYTSTVQLQFVIGITPWMDFQGNPQASYNTTRGQSDVLFEDLPLGFDFQLLSAEKYDYFPGIKLGITETFPTGNYQKLSPKKLGTDISGLGSYSTAVGLVFYKIYHLKDLHFLAMTASFQPTFYAPVSVKGYSVYRGASSTRGTVYPGTTISAIVSFEYTFDKNWVFAIDNVYIHNNKDRFSGRKGFVSPGTPAVVGRPSSEQLSFAPAIEYNFNAKFGIVAGAWLTATGRNIQVFRAGVLSCLYTY